MTCLTPAITTGVVMCFVIWLFITRLYLPYDAAYKARIRKYNKAKAHVTFVCDDPKVMLLLGGEDDCVEHQATLLESPRDEAIKLVMHKYDYECGSGGCFALSVNWLTLIGLILPLMSICVVLIVVYVAVVIFRKLGSSSDLPSWNPAGGGGGGKKRHNSPYEATNVERGLASIVIDALSRRKTQ